MNDIIQTFIRPALPVFLFLSPLAPFTDITQSRPALAWVPDGGTVHGFKATPDRSCREHAGWQSFWAVIHGEM